MVFFNYATMQMAAKIVYYGPGLCGKTTNLHHIYAKTSPQSRGEMVSLETETDRTLFFDLLPIDVGVIGGFKTRLQLYTIPGQVFYNTTRKLVLKGVDGIVFVADSQLAMQDANADSIRNLRENLSEIGVDLDEIPLVVQLNKRDLPNLADVDSMLDILDPVRKYEHIESVAASGVGVFETLKLISKLTLRTLRRRMTGDEAAKVTPGQSGKFAALRVKESPAIEGRGTITGSMPVPAVGTVSAPPLSAPAGASASTPSSTRTMPAVHAPEEDVEEIEPSEEISFAESALAKTADVGADVMSKAPVAQARKTAPVAPIAEPEEPEVKHVKVRSSVDIMAELEALRKRATAGTAPKVRKEVSPLDALRSPKKAAPATASKREVQKSLTMKVPAELLPKTKSLRVTVSFENSEGVLRTSEHTVDVSDATDAQSLSVNLRIDS